MREIVVSRHFRRIGELHVIVGPDLLDQPGRQFRRDAGFFGRGVRPPENREQRGDALAHHLGLVVPGQRLDVVQNRANHVTPRR